MQYLDYTIYDVTLWASTTYQYIYHITREMSRKLIREWQVSLFVYIYIYMCRQTQQIC